MSPGRNGVIAYERFGLDYESHGIWDVDTATGRKHRLATSGAFDPAWAPDGHLIAYRRRGHEQGIYVARGNGSRAERITKQADKHPAFAPTGNRIAFDRHRPGFGQASFTILSVRLDGSRPRRIAFGQDPVYSPGGRWIAYRRGGVGRGDETPSIRLVRPSGSDDHAIYTVSQYAEFAFIADLDWAPDGKRLAFEEPEGRGLVTLDPDGSDQLVLGAYGAPISYSPDGQSIAFADSSSTSRRTTVEAVPVGGGTPSPIASVNAYLGALAWQPVPPP